MVACAHDVFFRGSGTQNWPKLWNNKGETKGSPTTEHAEVPPIECAIRLPKLTEK